MFIRGMDIMPSAPIRLFLMLQIIITIATFVPSGSRTKQAPKGIAYRGIRSNRKPPNGHTMLKIPRKD
eukprot:2668938-Amphidinium_carterae.1